MRIDQSNKYKHPFWLKIIGFLTVVTIGIFFYKISGVLSAKYPIASNYFTPVLATILLIAYIWGVFSRQEEKLEIDRAHEGNRHVLTPEEKLYQPRIEEIIAKEKTEFRGDEAEFEAFSIALHSLIITVIKQPENIARGYIQSWHLSDETTAKLLNVIRKRYDPKKVEQWENVFEDSEEAGLWKCAFKRGLT